MENTFDLKKFLVENKLTSNSRLLKEEMSKDELQKKLFDIINSDKVQAILTKAVEKLTPAQQQALQDKTQALAEGSFDSFEKFKEFTEKGLEVLDRQGELNEEEVGTVGQEFNKFVSNTGKEIKQTTGLLAKGTGLALMGLGYANIISMGFLPIIVSAVLDNFAGTDIIATVGTAVGGGSETAVLSVVAGLLGGAIAYGLGQVVTGIGVALDPD